MIPSPVSSHYKRIQRVQVSAVSKARLAWRQVDGGNLSASWGELVAGYVLTEISDLQLTAAQYGAGYTAAALAAQGGYSAPEHFVNANTFSGQASDGRRLDTLLYAPITAAKSYLAQGATLTRAMEMGQGHLDAIVKTQITDAARVSAGVDSAARTGVGYTRMLNPPSCKDCVIQGGRFFRWNAGFDRHPNCDCVHIPTMAKSLQGAKDEGLITDPYEYFQKLSADDQRRIFGKGEAQAIRDGADISQTLNATRKGKKMTQAGLTTEGTSRRGNFRREGGTGERLTPEEIYRRAGSDRQEALRLLQVNKYILPGGQNPTGAILGQREGYGALGRGGTRVGARTAVDRARASGVRDQNVRATMTEFERRTYDATMQWNSVQAGRNPFGTKNPLTPEIAAAVENDYRQVVVYGNSMWKLTARWGR